MFFQKKIYCGHGATLSFETIKRITIIVLQTEETNYLHGHKRLFLVLRSAKCVMDIISLDGGKRLSQIKNRASVFSILEGQFDAKKISTALSASAGSSIKRTRTAAIFIRIWFFIFQVCHCPSQTRWTTSVRDSSESHKSFVSNFKHQNFDQRFCQRCKTFFFHRIMLNEDQGWGYSNSEWNTYYKRWPVIEVLYIIGFTSSFTHILR